MFELTEEEKAKIASGEWTLANVIAARLDKPAARLVNPEELEAKRTAAAASMLGYKPLESVVNESVGDGRESVDEDPVKTVPARVTDKRHTITPEQLKSKYESDMSDYASPSEKATEQMKNYGYEDPIKKNIRESVEAEIAKSNPERKTDYIVPERSIEVPERSIEVDGSPSIWSNIASMLSSMLPSKKKAGTAMTGWTRYNGGSSPIAAAYNNWLQGEKNRNAQAASQGANAIIQEQITKLNNEKASENLEASKRAEVQGKYDAMDDANYRADNVAFSSQYNQIETAIESAKLELKQIDPSDTKKKQDLEKQIAALETNRRTVLKNMKDNAESYGKPVSIRYKTLFDKYLTDERAESDEKSAQKNYDLTALATQAAMILAGKGRLRGDWRFAKDEESYNEKVSAFNKKLEELGVPASAFKPLDEVKVPVKSIADIESDEAKLKEKRAEWVEAELMKKHPGGPSAYQTRYMLELYYKDKAELQKRAEKEIFL